MAVEKKRPRGLKSSSANKKTTPVKKAKTDVDEKDIPENAQTVMINKEVEEGDEVGEAAALLDDAIDKLGNRRKAQAHRSFLRLTNAMTMVV
jgi:hypothetical protein